MTNDETFLSEFEACRWPIHTWHHSDHIKLAYLYLCRYPFDEALVKIRDGIKAHNAAHSVPESLDRGYHETITQAWMRLVHLAICEYGVAETAASFYEQHPELSQQKILRLFYSRELLTSLEAKTTFCLPDLAPLPVSP